LHHLGDERIQLDSDSALLTRKKDGTLELAVWNYAPPDQAGAPKTIMLRLKGTSATHALISRVDGNHGDFHSIYAKMGSPRYPTPAQIQQLRQAAELPAPQASEINHGELAITLPTQGLAVIEIK
jgi:xylan 1,4-beta-xylosidase